MKFWNLSLLLILFLFLSSCSPVFQNELSNLEQIELDPIQLELNFEKYQLRLDIIRDNQIPASFKGTRYNVPYSALGFYLGNSLFYDLNGNLSLLVDKLFEIGGEEDFEIIENASFKRKNHFVKSGLEYSKEFASFYPAEASRRIIKDLRIYNFRKRSLSKNSFGKTSFEFDGKQWIIKDKSTTRTFVKTEKGVNLDGQFFITQVENRIEIYKNRSYSRTPKLIYTLIKSKDKIYIFDKKNRGFKTTINEKRIEYWKNKKRKNSFERLK